MGSISDLSTLRRGRERKTFSKGPMQPDMEDLGGGILLRRNLFKVRSEAHNFIPLREG
jgi:hypothetical protein